MTPTRSLPSATGRWITSTSHKDIGTLYLVFSLLMFFVAGAMALLIRAELFQPGLQLIDPQHYNELVTMHGFIMIFGVIVPAWTGIMNWQLPLMLGAPDMALPRLNNFSFWLLPPAFLLFIGSMMFPGMRPDFGWTGYAPLSAEYSSGTAVYVFTIHMLGVSSIMAAINIITTITNMRAPQMKLMQMPLFAWAALVTAYLLIIAMAVLAAAASMLLADRYFGTTFFNSAGGGDPLLWQHLFWFFGHPEVYILILPAFGVISHIVPAFSRKRLFGYDYLIYSLLAIAILSVTVWAHHMFTVGLPVTGELFFMSMTMLIAVPTAVKIFNWVATMWRGAMSFETPMLFAIGFIMMFTVGGLSGIMLALVPLDGQYQDTYFVVAHFHYVIVAGSVFALFGAVYYWLPKWTGHYYSERLGKLHFWLSVAGVNLTFFPMHFLGLAGMQRRVPDYALQFTDFNRITTIGAFLFGVSQLVFAYVVLRTVRHGPPVPAKAWEGARGLEWTLDSPPPHDSFEQPYHGEIPGYR
ncbi:MAG: cytochrome c oxidase subunit I [Gammaproteobacteria bacterium]|jgi:cytochrome c oxidase subunit 1